jgi:hypothetical protein
MTRPEPRELSTARSRELRRLMDEAGRQVDGIVLAVVVADANGVCVIMPLGKASAFAPVLAGLQWERLVRLAQEYGG